MNGLMIWMRPYCQHRVKFIEIGLSIAHQVPFKSETVDHMIKGRSYSCSALHKRPDFTDWQLVVLFGRFGDVLGSYFAQILDDFYIFLLFVL